MRYNRLTVIGDSYMRLYYGTRRERFVMCRCDCGVEKEIRYQSLISGRTISCGCYGKEQSRKARFIHGSRTNPYFGIWTGIKTRCYNKNHESYKGYGGRGITMCEEWRSNFHAFAEWCENNGWKRGLQIDRENNDGNYEPGNCRIVQPKINARNRRSTKLNNTRIRVIRLLVDKYKLSQVKVAKLYNVSSITIHDVVRNKKWL